MSPEIRMAETQDVEAIYNLIKFYAVEGIILERSMEDILLNIHTFVVAFDGEKLIGAATFHDYGENLKEVRSLAVDREYHGRGVGKAILQRLIRNIRMQCRSKIFTLTYNPDFFSRNGFVPADKNEFPEKIWKDCINCRDREKCGETALVYSL